MFLSTDLKKLFKDLLTLQNIKHVLNMYQHLTGSHQQKLHIRDYYISDSEANVSEFFDDE